MARGTPSPSRHSACTSTAAALAVLTAGCAATPDVTVSYKPVAWLVGVSVVDTITCTRDAKQVIVVRGATFTPIYRADANAEPFKLQLKALDRYFADSDLTVNLTDDGRLKSINQSTTGQGEAISKAVVGAVAAIGAATVAAPALSGPAIAAAPPASRASALGSYSLRNGTLKSMTIPSKPRPDVICAVVRDWTAVPPSKGLPQISVVQTKTIGAAGSVDLNGSDEQATLLLNELKDAQLDLWASVNSNIVDAEAAQPIANPRNGVGSDEVPLKLQQTGSLSLKAIPKERTPKEKEAEPIGSATITVPLLGTFELPIPKAALFGKQSFSLALADSGRITSIGYGSTAGAPGALNALSSVAGVQSAEDSAEAAARQAAADLIAQQSRLSGCLLNHADCKP